MLGSTNIARRISVSSRTPGRPWRRSTAMPMRAGSSPRSDHRIASEGPLQFALNEVPIGIPMPAVYCEIIKHAIGPRSAFELTLFGQVYNLAAATRLGIVQQSVAPDKLLEAAVAWAALVPPACYTAYAFSKRALQATTMAAIDAAARLGRDLLSRGMSDLGSIRAHTRRYKELKGRDVTWPLPA